MKNRLHDKKAGIAILISLIVLSLAEIVFRHFFLREMISFTANYAETLAVLILALTILIFTLKGKDRLCYILYGALIAYFVLNQFFELSGHFIYVVTSDVWSNSNIIVNIGLIVHVLSYVGIIVMGILLVEYMNDGSIYNRAFNITFALTLVLLLVSVCISVFNFVMGAPIDLLLLVFNNIYRIIMVVLFTFFAYDSAKKQLNKVNFS